MCTVSEEDLDIANLNLDKKCENDLKDSNCKKCSLNKAIVVLRTRDSYCRDCFLKYATHKFRATLGKSKIVKPKDRILIASSGSQASLALLHLVSEGLSERNNKRFLFSSLAVYIDEGAIMELSREERLEALKTVAKQAEDLNFPFYAVQLSNSLNLESIQILPMNSKGEGIDLNERRIVIGDNQLMSLFQATKTLTSKEDLLGVLRQNLLLAVAKELDCNKILLADVGSQLAVKLISNVSVGRGAHLQWDTGFCDMRDPAVMILRPLKEFMSREIAFYCVLNQLNGIALPSFSSKASRMASIRRLTEDFLYGLHIDFPSTFSAVIKTGDKLAPPLEGQERCILCKATLGQQFRECSSQQATQFSKELVGQINSKSEVPCSKDTGGSGDSSGGGEGVFPGGMFAGNPSTMEADSFKWNVEGRLCYGCHLIANDMDNADKFLEKLDHSSTHRKKSTVDAVTPLSPTLDDLKDVS